MHIKSVIRIIICCIIFFTSFYPGKIYSSDTERPKIGLVLSGGGAKGLAHIGFLKVMEEAGIRPDFIGGTSMGSIIGGLYAIGYSADSLEKIAKGLNWNFLLSDEISRHNLTIEEKDDNDRFIFSFPLKEKKILIPSGLVNGQNIENTLNLYCSPVFGIRNFDELQIPFLTVATDMETGKEVIFREGYLPEVMRASMAIPSVFRPVEINNKLLVDGGVINNFPVKRVKEMGADIIIGVDVGFQIYNKEELNNIIKIIEQTVFFYGEELNVINKSLADYLIVPNLKEFNAGSFNAVDTIIARGEQAARLFLPHLKSLADSLRQLDPGYKVQQKLPELDSISIKEININGLKRVSIKLLDGKLQLDISEKYTAQDIKASIDRAFSSLYFEKVSWELEEKEDQSIKLNINVQESKGGLFRVGLHYDSDYKAAMLLNTTFRNLLLDGSKLSTNLSLGENPFLNISYFKNNGWKPGFGMDINFNNFEEFVYNENGRKISNLSFTENSIQLYSQSILLNSYAIGIGAKWQNISLKPRIDPSLDLVASRSTYLDYFGYINMDTYNNTFFPNHGLKAFSEIRVITQKELGPILFLYGRLSKATSISPKVTLLSYVFGGLTLGDSIPYTYYFYTGGLSPVRRNGQIPFVGMNFLERANKNALIIRADIQWEIFRNFYITFKGNAGNLKSSLNELLILNKVMSGVGITLSYNSWIGPIEYSLMRSLNKSGLISFINISHWF